MYSKSKVSSLGGGGGRGGNLAYNVFFPRYAVIIFFEGVITQLRYFNRSVPMIASPQTSFGVRFGEAMPISDLP